MPSKMLQGCGKTVPLSLVIKTLSFNQRNGETLKSYYTIYGGLSILKKVKTAGINQLPCTVDVSNLCKIPDSYRFFRVSPP